MTIEEVKKLEEEIKAERRGYLKAIDDVISKLENSRAWLFPNNSDFIDVKDTIEELKK